MSYLFRGMALGLGLGFTLSLVEEMGRNQQVSWPRIFIRTGISMVGSALVFMLGFFVRAFVVDSMSLIADLLMWLLFGLVIGWALSLKSRIETSKGILGGLGAGSLAFLFYYFSSKISGNTDLSLTTEITKMVSFVVLGAVLGITTVSVVTQLEDFWMEIVSPTKHRNVTPISKWLKKGLSVHIGSSPECEVQVFWADNHVSGKHAMLSYDKHTVFIEPFEEVLVNQAPIPYNKATPLTDGRWSN